VIENKGAKEEGNERRNECEREAGRANKKERNEESKQSKQEG
jgi:hypothetical protein